MFGNKNKQVDKSEEIVTFAIIFAGLAVALFAVYLLFRNPDIDFARNAFSGLVNESQSAEKFVDWQKFKAMGIDVSSTYATLITRKQRADFLKVFLKSLSTAFRDSGGSIGAFVNWRIYSADDRSAVIAADYLTHKKTILFTITKDNKRKLIGIQWSGDTK